MWAKPRASRRDTISRVAGQLLDACAGGHRWERPCAQDERRLLVGPRAEAEDDIERVAADDDGIHARHELLVAVRLVAAGVEKIELSVRPSEEAIEAGADED